jgi:DNA-directed RNA polymerase subunit F
MSINDRLVLLYLTPKRLFQENDFLALQWDVSETLIPCFLRTLYYGDIYVRLHEFDKIVTGLKNRIDQNDVNTFAKIATFWYYFTRVTHQSLGPRIGSFAQRAIAKLIDSSNLYSVGNYIDITLGKALSQIFGIKDESKGKVDFVAIKNDRSSVAFIELRLSEHTGGRTGQESLMDKFNKILDLILEKDSGKNLFDDSKSKGIKAIELVFAILFNENHELIRESNYNQGRLNSLISYIMQQNHLWGRIKKLKDNEFKLCDGGEISESVIADRLRGESRLSEKREVCLEKDAFRVYIKILLGDEFFLEYTGKGFDDLIKEYSGFFADDLWVMYLLTINELKIAKLLGDTNVRRIYDDASRNQELGEFLNEFQKLYNNSSKKSLEEYINSLNDLLSRLAHKVLEFYSGTNRELKLLETNDVAQNYLYLKYTCVGVLAVYLTINIKKDESFSMCRWEVGAFG